MQKLVYKYNGDTQIIRFNSAEKFNQYLVKNISEIELIEDVEVVDLCAPVEVEEAPKEASKADISVKDVIQFLITTSVVNADTTSDDYTDLAPIIEYVVDRLITDLQLKRICADRGISLDTEEAAVELDSDSVIEWLEQNSSDVIEPIIEYILQNHLSDDEIIELADNNGLTIINDEELAIDYLSDEGYACLNTANEGLKDNIEELISYY
jgi:hypothetical protein